jgi:uncharacterized protein (TIGR03435 family)
MAVSVAAIVRAQAPTSTTARFEVASVKPNKSGNAVIGGSGLGKPGEFQRINVPLRVLILEAYRIRSSALIGGPSWIATDRFDVVARAAQPGPLVEMVKTLLADRFKLVTHNETRELPIYALTIARRDGRLGPNLHPSTCGTSGRDATQQPCRVRIAPGLFVGSAPIFAPPGGAISLGGELSSELQREVVDRTGLKGTFDVDLHWLPDNSPAGPQPGAPPPDTSTPSIFTAVQEQLGLKLQSTKGPVDVLVIDRIEHPTPD